MTRVKRRFSRLYINYFLLIFFGMALILGIVTYSVLTISQTQLRNELDAADFRAAGKVVTIMDSALDEIAYRAVKLASNQDILSYLRLPRDYVGDYSAIELRARCINYMTVAQRNGLDAELLIYSSANDAVLSTVTGFQTLARYRNGAIVNDYIARVSPPHRSYFQPRMILRYGSGASLPPFSVWVLTYYCGITQGFYQDDFIAVNVMISSLNTLMRNESSDDSEILVLDADDNFMFSTNMERMNDVSGTGSLVRQINDAIEDGAADSSGDGESGAPSSGVRLKLDTGKDMYVYSLTSNLNGWRYIQLLPCAPYEVSIDVLMRSLLTALVLVFILSAVLSMIISKRVFRPIKSIIALLDDPAGFTDVDSSNSEVRYILMSVLEAYQKNILLEREMMEHFEQLRAARIRALQLQMSPHFLYNTLQAISWLVLAETHNEDSPALEAIAGLSSMSRYCMEGESMLIDVKSEAAYVREYVALQRLRFGDDVKCDLIIEPGVEQMLLPRLSLQTLVENAFKYGLRDRRGVIIVKCYRNGDALCTSVEDNGAGMSPERMAYLEEQFEKNFALMDKNVGLINLNQRLKLIFGKSSMIELSTNESGGLTVRFSVPCRMA